MCDDDRNYWEFSFAICSNEANAVMTETKCDELLDLIIEWAEANNLQIGGGYKALEISEGE